jgi:hypothetical protein
VGGGRGVARPPAEAPRVPEPRPPPHVRSESSASERTLSLKRQTRSRSRELRIFRLHESERSRFWQLVSRSLTRRLETRAEVATLRAPEPGRGDARAVRYPERERGVRTGGRREKRAVVTSGASGAAAATLAVARVQRQTHAFSFERRTRWREERAVVTSGASGAAAATLAVTRVQGQTHAFSFERRTQLRHRELRVFRRSSESIKTVQNAWSAPPQQLVWRSAPRPQTEAAAETAAIRPVAVPPQPSRTAGTAMPVTNFDAALLDRLTDDVIRRVERRVRIERERRGL